MHTPLFPHRLGWVAAFAIFMAGCGTGPGNPFALIPEGHRLIPEAKELRAAAVEPAALPRELAKQPAPDYVVEPGDVLLVTPADLDSPIRLPGDQPIFPDGTINLGRYGRVPVAGRTVEEARAAVQQAVEAVNKDAGLITVRVVVRASKVYYVIGEVNAPGAFPLSGRETVLDALLAAGGLNDRASRDNITLSRPSPPCGCRTVLPICYPEIVQLGDTSTNYQIQAGDRIYVPTKTCREQLFPTRQKPCPPCGRPQTPCPLPPERCPNAPACGACSVSQGDASGQRPSLWSIRPAGVARAKNEGW
jgi:protein involved in polysaccharide export with SLBB domain